MLNDHLDQLDETVLRKLCADKSSESQSLDFKRELPGKLNQDKHELLKDVCAMANADGGDLVYGISDVDGVADSIEPIQVEDYDSASRRISQVLDAGLDPRVQGLQCSEIRVEPGYILVVRVPASFDGPHCVRMNSSRRFVVRIGTITSDMSYQQIRDAFDRTATLAEKARSFIKVRHELLKTDTSARALNSGPISVLHAIPIAGISGRHTVNLQPLYARGYTDFIDKNWGASYDRTFNLDGVKVASPATSAYNQIFREGTIEYAANVGVDNTTIGGAATNVIFTSELITFYRQGVNRFLNFSKRSGFAGPAVLGVAILRVGGYQLRSGQYFYSSHDRSPVDRDNLILPEVWIDNIESADCDKVIGPMMDVLWQSFGLDRCEYFDPETGVYDSTGR